MICMFFGITPTRGDSLKMRLLPNLLVAHASLVPNSTHPRCLANNIFCCSRCRAWQLVKSTMHSMSIRSLARKGPCLVERLEEAISSLAERFHMALQK